MTSTSPSDVPGWVLPNNEMLPTATKKSLILGWRKRRLVSGVRRGGERQPINVSNVLDCCSGLST